MKVTTTLYRRMVLLDRPLDAPIEDVPRRLDVRLAEATEGDLDAYLAFHADQPEGLARARFRRGDRCFAVWDGERIAHAAWAATGRTPIGYLERDLLLEPDEMYAYDAYTHPDYRGNGLCSLRGVDMLRRYRGLGFRRSYGLAQLENRAGFAQVRTVGYVPIGMYVYVRLGPLRRDRAYPFGLDRMPALGRPAATAPSATAPSPRP
jgi:GNAT superfamily N-acetyltransferase